MADWFVYVLRCRDGSLYTGVTTDVSRRLAEHASGGPKAARYVRGRGPLVLIFSHQADSHSAALALEYWIKSLPRKRKLAFLAGTLKAPIHRLEQDSS